MQAEEIVRDFVKGMNEEFNPDVVVDLGDRILDVDEDTDFSNQLKVKRALGGLKCPVIHVIGNHDLVNLTIEQNEELFGCPMRHASFDHKGIHFVVLNTCDPVIQGVGGHISQAQLDWLRTHLDANPTRTIVLCHHAMGYQEISANPLFHSIEPLAYVANRDDVWEVLRNHGQVIAVFNGHLHWSSVEHVSGTPCFSAGCPVETWATKGKASESYAEVTMLQSGHITFESMGIAPRTFRYDPRLRTD